MTRKLNLEDNENTLLLRLWYGKCDMTGLEVAFCMLVVRCQCRQHNISSINWQYRSQSLLILYPLPSQRDLKRIHQRL